LSVIGVGRQVRVVLSVYCAAGFSEEISLQNIFTFQILWSIEGVD
jgi:hypothetical protein